ncbi:MAG: hypothetical protein LBR53_07140 [Deltaproteobacteria bacterium]|jgi:hypothetical protein|nr:hypothetical protein [Deltaproteobacteria bacterium]
MIEDDFDYFKDICHSSLSDKEIKALKYMTDNFYNIRDNALDQYLEIVKKHDFSKGTHSLTLPHLMFSTYAAAAVFSEIPVTLKYNLSSAKYRRLVKTFLTLAVIPFESDFNLSKQELDDEFLNNEQYDEMIKSLEGINLNYAKMSQEKKNTTRHQRFESRIIKHQVDYVSALLELCFDMDYVDENMIDSDVLKNIGDGVFKILNKIIDECLSLFN